MTITLAAPATATSAAPTTHTPATVASSNALPAVLERRITVDEDSPLAALVAPADGPALLPALPLEVSLGAAIAAGAMPTAVSAAVDRAGSHSRTPTAAHAAKEAPPFRPLPTAPPGPQQPWASAIAAAAGTSGAALGGLLLIAILFSSAFAVPPRTLGRLLGLATGSGSVGYAQVVHRPG